MTILSVHMFQKHTVKSTHFKHLKILTLTYKKANSLRLWGLLDQVVQPY